jgi:crotonobetaine/carnitine-CoA ligase
MRGVVADILRSRAREDPDKLLIKCGGDWRSAGEVDRRSDTVAAGLAALGLTKGQRIAFIVPNRDEYIDLFFASAKIGAVQVPLNIFLKGEFLRYQIADSGADILVADAMGLRSAAGLLAGTDVRCVVVLDDGTELPALPDHIVVVRFRELLVDALPPAVDLDPADLFIVLYTSGTTGLSKGCLLSNGYVVEAAHPFRERDWIRTNERVINAFYLFHGSALSVLMQVLTTSGCSVCFEPKFSATTLMNRAREERAQILWGLGPIAMAILNQTDLTVEPNNSLRLAAFPGMPGAFQEQFEERFGVAVCGEAYGQSECLPITIGSVGGGRGTMGLPAPHLHVRLVDGEDQAVPEGEVGEIVVRPRGPHGMYSGYWNKPAETVQAWRSLWHHTGDLARQDVDGCLIFVDRKKDSMRRRGENVSSLELETAIGRHPQITEVAVCAVPAALGEDDIKACIVWRGAPAPDPQSLFEFFTEHLPYFAIPRYVQIRESLPTTDASGRVRKHVLRAEGITSDTWDLESLAHSSARR